MVKGVTRQVVVVKGTGEKLFDQAIFLVREDALAKGGITEDALLAEARTVCKQGASGKNLLQNILFACCGAFATGILWTITAFL